MSTVLQTSEAHLKLCGSELGSPCITEYALADGRQVFRTPAPGDPFAVACLPMLPWCNRISGGVTTADGFHPIAPNVPGQDCPLHGSGFQSAWTIEDQGPDRIIISLRSQTPAPFDFHAVQELRLTGADLSITLSVTHLGTHALPYGLGLHPWFPRTEGTLLHAPSTYYQAVDSALLPTGNEPIAERPEWDYSTEAPLPEGLIDTCFGGWDGQARLTWPDRDLSLDIETSPKTAWYQVYSPSSDCGFFCFEPVSHPINAHNMADNPGLAVLEPGQSTMFTVTFRPKTISQT